MRKRVIIIIIFPDRRERLRMVVMVTDAGPVVLGKQGNCDAFPSEFNDELSATCLLETSFNQSIKQILRRPFYKAAEMTNPRIPVLSQSPQLSPGVASFFDVCFQIAAPCVSRSSSFPFPLWIPG